MAGKGTDRLYASPVSLAHRKRKGFYVGFSIYIYIYVVRRRSLMKTRSSSSLYKIECYIFKGINHYFERKTLNIFFGTITHMGGATFTISLIIFLLVLTSGSLRGIAITSAISLAISHISVRISKKSLPRKRPYLTIHNAKYPTNPLMDHSFPSGHTTAIFSVIIPFLLYEPHRHSCYFLLQLA